MKALVIAAALLAVSCGGSETTVGGTDPEVVPDTAAATPPEPELPDPRLDDALRAIAAGDFEGASALAERVAAERPSSARAAFVTALALHKQKNYGAAIPRFDRALELGPTFEPFAPVHYFRGWCLYNLGRLAEARAAFETHLALVPDDGDSRFALGLIASDEGRLADAREGLTAALRDAEARIARGQNDRRADAAKARARLADLELMRDDVPRVEALAAARAQLEAALETYPPHYTTWYKLHQVLTEQGEDELAAIALRNHDDWKARVRPGSEGLGQ